MQRLCQAAALAIHLHLNLASGEQVWRKEESEMPGRQHLRGVSDKEQRQYEHINESGEKSGRYGKRAEEVAARTVLKEHKLKGHKKGH